MNRDLQLLAAVTVLCSVEGVSARQLKPPCLFTIVRPVPPTWITGPDAIKARAYVIPQPGSPVAILGIDLTGTELTLENGELSYTTNWVIDLQNVSDVAVTDVRLVATFLPGLPKNGVLDASSELALTPSQRTSVTWRGRGSAAPVSSDEAFLFAFVDSMRIGSCTYSAARALPPNRHAR